MRFTFRQVADNSSIPIVLYNFPGIANGIDLDFDLIKGLAAHPNIVGIKLSCGSVSKGEWYYLLKRLESQKPHLREPTTGARLQSQFDAKDFGVYGGLADT